MELQVITQFKRGKVCIVRCGLTITRKSQICELKQIIAFFILFIQWQKQAPECSIASEKRVFTDNYILSFRCCILYVYLNMIKDNGLDYF